MKTIFYLKTCGTCTRILNEINPDSSWQLREIKSEPVTEAELEELYRVAGSYDRLFSKKSSQIKVRNLDIKTLKEEDFKTLLLGHYTFLKRPVVVDGDEIFIGSDKSNLENLKHHLTGKA